MGSGSLGERAVSSGWCTIDEWYDATGNTGAVGSRHPAARGRRTYAADGSLATGELGLTVPRLLEFLDGWRDRRRGDLLALGSVVATAFAAPDKLESLLAPELDPVDQANRSYRYWSAEDGDQPE